MFVQAARFGQRPPLGRLALVLVSSLWCWAAARPGSAQQIEQVTVAIKMTAKVDEAGNARLRATMTFNPPRAYDRVKKAYPNLYVLFRDLGNERANTEIDRDTLSITSDDGKRNVSFSADALGYAVCKKNRWQVTLDKNEDVVTEEGNKVFTTLVSTPRSGTNLTGTMTYLLPAGAQTVQVDKERRLITYGLAAKPLAKNAGEPSVDVSVRSKKRIMSSMYKIYADEEVGDGAYWVAKTIVKNTGSVPLYDLKVTYRLGEYSEMSVPERYSQVLPKGAVVDVYHPLISSKVTQLRTQTPTQLYVKYEYKDAKGKVYEEETAKRLEVLGVNQFEFSNLSDEDKTDSWFDAFNNAPLLAAYVTKMDDAVKQFAGYISEASGGAAAASRDEDALKWLKAAYDMQLVNNIVYQTPSGFMTADRSSGQEIKYPRDVFRDKSGTCVDLAITYAALAEAVGLSANLMLVPGHCFAVVRLPGGQLVPVENTGLGGGDQRMSFEQAVQRGTKELQEYAQQGLFYLVDVTRELTENKIPNPELPPVAADFLDKAGIKRVGLAGAAGLGFEGQWQGKLGEAEMVISLAQSDKELRGKLMLRGATPVNEDITATIDKDNSIRVNKRTDDLIIELSGIRTGSTISGTFKVTERLAFGIRGETATGNWTVERK